VWTFTLLDQIDHATGNNENDLTLNLGSIIQATDKDGDPVTAPSTAIQVVVDDDSPIYVTGAVSSGTVDEDGIVEDATAGLQQGDGIAGGTGDVAGTATVATGSVTGLFLSGADEPLSYSLSSDTSGLPSLTSGGTLPSSFMSTA